MLQSFFQVLSSAKPVHTRLQCSPLTCPETIDCFWSSIERTLQTLHLFLSGRAAACLDGGRLTGGIGAGAVGWCRARCGVARTLVARTGVVYRRATAGRHHLRLPRLIHVDVGLLVRLLDLTGCPVALCSELVISLTSRRYWKLLPAPRARFSSIELVVPVVHAMMCRDFGLLLGDP